MKRIMLIAVLVTPLCVHAAHFQQESVTFDKDGKPVISASLTKPPLIPNSAKTTPTDNKNNEHRHSKSPSELQSGLYQSSHFIYPDETYFDAINRWSKRDGIDNLAWSLNAKTDEVLHRHPVSTASFNGTTLDVVSQLSHQLGEPFDLALDNFHHLAAIHQWKNRGVQISMFGGSTLKDALEKLTINYGWQWINDPEKPSWLASHDYTVSVSYPIVTPKDDFRRALQIVLKGYPVSARLLEGSHTLFITDTH